MQKEIQVQDLTVHIERKAIKHLYIRIKPDGRIVVTCPNRTADREIRYLVEERYNWIVSHRQRVLDALAVQPPSYTSGETIPLWGEGFRLRVVEQPGPSSVVLEHNEIVLRGPLSDESGRRQQLNAFYRAQLNTVVPALMEQASAATGLHPNEWRIRDMHTRWGSCNIPKRRIWLSLNLAKYPPECLYSVIIHELCHLLETGHNARFYGLMDRFYPSWRKADALLKAGTPIPSDHK